MRRVLLVGVIFVSGCGSCLESSSGGPGDPPASTDPNRAVGPVKLLPRRSNNIPSATIRDAGAGDE